MAMRARWLLGSVLSAGLLSCGSTEDAVCTAKCDCEFCSDRDFNECLDHLDADFRAADRLGCADLYDELLACEDDTGRCRGSDFDTSCGPEKDRLERCIGDDGESSCLVDSDCSSGGHPFCGPAHACVECVVASHCGDGKTCVSNKCQGGARRRTRWIHRACDERAPSPHWA